MELELEEDLARLEELSLVSKICTELENHLGVGDKDLAEFIIALAGKHSTLEKFQTALLKNGADFPVRFDIPPLVMPTAVVPKCRVFSPYLCSTCT